MNQGRTALLAMDFQNWVVARLGDGGSPVVERVNQAINHARDANIMVVYVRVAFRDGHPEVSPANRMFARIVGGGDFAETAQATQIHAAIAPRDGDIVVTKRRVSAFTGSDLEVILRAQHVSTLVLAGIGTGGVVLSTVREAADRDYRIIVLSDACADADPDTHRFLIEKVFPRQAIVVPVDDWIQGQGAAE
jgi:nicotinamidase-related amidase